LQHYVGSNMKNMFEIIIGFDLSQTSA